MISATQKKKLKLEKTLKSLSTREGFSWGSFVKVRNQSLKVEGAAPQWTETTLHKSWFYFAHSCFRVI